MAIIRQNPFRDLINLSERLGRIMEEGGSHLKRDDDFLTGSWSPAVDIYETSNEVVLKVELPGMTEKDVELDVENNMLTIKGERKYDESVNKDSYHRVERVFGSFQRTFQLPSNINVSLISAEQENGILTIVLPKKEEQKQKKIKIDMK